MDDTRPIGDPWLLTLARLVRLPEDEMGITLCIPSGVVTGLLVTSERWFDELTGSMDRAGGGAPGLAQTLRESLVQVELTDEPDSSAGPPAFIHLIDVYHAPSGLEAKAWRGRFDAVTGWSIGRSLLVKPKPSIFR